eukprot:Gb_00727 [translate_table: standard]
MAFLRGFLAFILIIFLAIGSEAFVPSILSRPSTWNPFGELWHDPFKILEENPLSALSGDMSEISLTRVDWKETSEAHIIKIDVPGIKKDDVKIEYKDDVLTISGERRKEKNEESDQWHRVEQAVGKFVKQFRLPNGHMEGIKARLDNGVLVVSVPKIESKSGEVKSVSIEGGNGIEKQQCVEAGDNNACKA